MDPRPQLPKGRDGVSSMLNEAMKDLNIVKEASSITPAKAVFGSVGALLPTIRVSQCVAVGRSLTNVCRIRAERVMSNWGLLVLTFVEPSTGD